GGDKRGVAVEVQPGVSQLGLVPKQLRLQLLYLDFEGTRVDFDKQFSLANLLPLPEVYLHDLPVDAALYVRGVERGYGAQPRQINGNILLLHRSHGYRNGTRRPGGLGFARLRIGGTAATNQPRADCRKHQENRRARHIHRLDSRFMTVN